jgi:branched-chain amino acid transport system ATP-binding protein
MSLLETRGVTVQFGGNHALDDVSLTIRSGEVTGLIGPNGAGKTTLFNCITGMQRLDAGQVLFDGSDVTGRSPGARARDDMARTFQRLELFLSLSVRDNVRVAGDIVRANSSRRIDVDRETDRVLELTGLSDIAAADVAHIPTGRARVVEVARALMTSPRLLLLDEPASGQTERESDQFADLLRRLTGDGIGICLVEHDLPLVMGICSVIHVLDHGKLIATGTPTEVQRSAEVIEAYIGTEVVA